MWHRDCLRLTARGVHFKRGGKVKLHAALALGLFLYWSNVNALSGKTPPRNDGSGSIQCAWYDSGKKEEHGIHHTEQDCKAHHGSCSERCFVYESVCKVEGIRVEFEKTADGKIERKELKTEFRGQHRDEWRAREIADRECLTASPLQDRCLSTGCYEDAVRVK